MSASSARLPEMPLPPPGREPERGGGTDPAAREVGQANRPAESEDEKGKAAEAADGDSARDFKNTGRV